MRKIVDWRSLLRGGISGVALLKALSLVFGVLLTIALARILSPLEFGRYSYAFSLAALLALPVLQGLPVLALREVSRTLDDARLGATRAILSFSNRLVAAIAAVMLVGIGIRFHFDPGLDLGLAVAASLLPLVMVSALVRGSVLRAFGRPFLGHLPDMLVRPAIFLLLLALLLMAPQQSAVVAMGLHLAAAGFALVLASRLIPQGPGAGGYEALEPRQALRSLVPLSTVAGMQLINSQVDVVMIGLLATKEEVGVYRIATMLALQVSFMLTVVNAVFAPRFASLYRNRDIAALRRINRRGAVLAFLFGLMVVVVYLAAGEWLIVTAVGTGYASAYVPLVILSLAHLLTLWAGTTNVLLTMIGRERDVLIAAGVAVSTNVLLCILLVPRFGLVGAASGSAASLVVWRVMLSRFLHVHLAAAERS